MVSKIERSAQTAYTPSTDNDLFTTTTIAGKAKC
jgi:hypothetical protein